MDEVAAEILGFNPDTGDRIGPKGVGRIQTKDTVKSQPKLEDLLRGRRSVKIDGLFAASDNGGHGLTFREYFEERGDGKLEEVAGITFSGAWRAYEVSGYHIRKGPEQFSVATKPNETSLSLRRIGEKGVEDVGLYYDKTGERFMCGTVSSGPIIGGRIVKFDSKVVQDVIIGGPKVFGHGEKEFTLDYDPETNKVVVKGLNYLNRPYRLSFSPQINVDEILNRVVPSQILKDPLRTPPLPIYDRWRFADNAFEWGIELE